MSNMTTNQEEEKQKRDCNKDGHDWCVDVDAMKDGILYFHQYCAECYKATRLLKEEEVYEKPDEISSCEEEDMHLWNVLDERIVNGIPYVHLSCNYCDEIRSLKQMNLDSEEKTRIMLKLFIGDFL
jgi:hypothetical protein